jgi:hypothetical protein
LSTIRAKDAHAYCLTAALHARVTGFGWAVRRRDSGASARAPS